MFHNERIDYGTTELTRVCTPCRPAPTLTYRITSETRRCTKPPSPAGRYLNASHRFSLLFSSLFLTVCFFFFLLARSHSFILAVRQSIKPINEILIRRLSCCCCTMMHVQLSSMGQHRLPKMSLKILRSEACSKVRDSLSTNFNGCVWLSA